MNKCKHIKYKFLSDLLGIQDKYYESTKIAVCLKCKKPFVIEVTNNINLPEEPKRYYYEE